MSEEELNIPNPRARLMAVLAVIAAYRDGLGSGASAMRKAADMSHEELRRIVDDMIDRIDGIGPEDEE